MTEGGTSLAQAYVQIIPSAQGISAGAIQAIGGELQQAGQATDSWQQALSSVKAVLVAGLGAAAAVTAIKGITGAIKGAVDGAYNLAVSAGQAADNIMTMASVSGTSAQSLQEWQYASNFIDTSVESISGSMRKLTMNMTSGSAETTRALKKLHVTIKEGGQMRGTEEVFWDIIDALGKIPNETQRSQMAMALLGRSAAELNPLIEAGSEAFRSMGQEAQSMGAVLSQSQLDKLGGFDDAVQRMKASAEGLKNTIGANLVPAFQPLVDAMAEVQGKMANLLGDGMQGSDIQQIAETIKGAFGPALQGVGETIKAALPGILEALRAVFEEIAQFAQSELPGIMEQIGSFLSEIGSIIGPMLEPIGSAICQALGSVISSALSSVDWGQLLLGVGIAIVTGLFKAIGQAIVGMAHGLDAAFAEIGSAIAQGIQNAMTSVGDIGTQLGDMARGWMNGLGQGIRSGVESALEAIRSLPQRIMEALANAAQQFAEAGRQMAEGLVQGIQQKANDIVESIIGPVRGAIEKAKSFLGIHSPSRLMRDQIGRQMVAGLAAGISGSAGLAEDAMRNVSEGVVSAADADLSSALSGQSAGINRQAAEGTGAGSGGFTQNVTVNSPQALSPYEVARQTRTQTRNMVLSMLTG